MSNSYVQALIPKIKAILEGSDLSTVSAKAVRKQLVAAGEDEATIKASRGAIDEEISTIYDQLTSAAPPSPPSSEDVPLHPKAEPGSSQPRPLQTFIKREVKPSVSIDEDDEETDEQMARRLQSEFNDQASSSRPRRANATAPAKKKKKTTKKRISRASVGGSEEENGVTKKKRKVNPDNPFNREMILSDALADLVSAPRLSRPQVVKQIWAYVKENGFQDQTDKRYILCDEKLKKVFHTDRLHMFTMNKILVDHLRNPDDVIFKAESKDGIKKEVQSNIIPTSIPIPAAPAIQSTQYISEEEDEDESEDENY
ncbi:uncharacterized protein I206_106618 [Kwoniella pini CBS 10737]|uniref:Uncharacterized protein n=1 Tax=Kwoniella pini CBS 10737 TaxID=1296096 RepID=A0A1B9HTN8_9TREE|nr:uncharacterized protein I206_07491 [Kwoniella pini CBS 10737]OCF46638.1 hypothetical protein I206_07491 [Kwoniella pini CBS 10737]